MSKWGPAAEVGLEAAGLCGGILGRGQSWARFGVWNALVAFNGRIQYRAAVHAPQDIRFDKQLRTPLLHHQAFAAMTFHGVTSC